MNKATILKLAFDYYGTQAQYPWEKFPDFAVLRHGTEGKWYAVIMNVEKRKLGLPGDGETMIMNVKCEKQMTGSIRMNEGILPAYHMNKENWVSIIIDERTDDELVLTLLDISFELTKTKKKR